MIQIIAFNFFSKILILKKPTNHNLLNKLLYLLTQTYNQNPLLPSELWKNNISSLDSWKHCAETFELECVSYLKLQGNVENVTCFENILKYLTNTVAKV